MYLPVFRSIDFSCFKTCENQVELGNPKTFGESEDWISWHHVKRVRRRTEAWTGMHGVHGGKAELDRQGAQHMEFSHAGRGGRTSQDPTRSRLLPALGGSCATRLVPRANGCVAVANLWQQDEALRMPKDLLGLCAGKARRQGWGNEFIPSCAKSEPRLVKTQPGLFQGKASTFELLFIFSHYLSISPPLHPF